MSRKSSHLERLPAPLGRKHYARELRRLQIELVKLHRQVIARGHKVLVILEGRDSAGKDGTIKRIVEHLSPREVRIVAPGKPSEPRTERMVLPALRRASAGGAGDRAVQPQLVQPRRRRVRHEVLYAPRARCVSRGAPRFERMLGARRDFRAQVLSRHQPRRAGAAAARAPPRSAQAMEDHPRGRGCAAALARLQPRPRHACSRHHIARRRGSWCGPTTSTRRASTSSATCWRAFPPRKSTAAARGPDLRVAREFDARAAQLGLAGTLRARGAATAAAGRAGFSTIPCVTLAQDLTPRPRPVGTPHERAALLHPLAAIRR